MILNSKVRFFPMAAVCAATVVWGHIAQADSKVFVPQAQDRVGSVYVLQAHQVRNVRAAAAARAKRAQQARARQARAQQQQVQAVSVQDAEILELPASGLPVLPNAHIAVR
ncbi:hypothetical protein [Thalassobius sp. Cn5-15]|uniref:hypothetical protein n=1 Tax=Thalassobius sp. Cn5-15 TaxID=2917763 RepID=UPI001EF3C74D|nr:hypothetical protein [Thalassobius sp. Cn5-15]MCG7493171.1 hypothetical protein [Thalassobius sp. Cn5-15]